MFTLSLLVLAGALVYLFRHYHANNHPPIMRKLLGRLRFVLGVLIVALLTTIAYQMPTELGRYFKRVIIAQNALANDREAARIASETQRARQMIDAFGGVDNYLAYLKWQRSAKN